MYAGGGRLLSLAWGSDGIEITRCSPTHVSQMSLPSRLSSLINRRPGLAIPLSINPPLANTLFHVSMSTDPVQNRLGGEAAAGPVANTPSDDSIVDPTMQAVSTYFSTTGRYRCSVSDADGK